jgi:DHA1 family multidrug resistance protein-like MFS transporter
MGEGQLVQPPSLTEEQSSGPWRRTLALFAVVTVFELFLVSHLSAFGPLYLSRLGVATPDLPRWTGFVNALPFVVGFPLVPFWGVWAVRYGRKVILARAAVVEIAVSLVAALAQEPMHLVVAFALSGLQLGNTGIMYAALADMAPRRRVGVAIGMMGTASTLGFALGPSIGGLVADRFSIRALFAMDALLAAIAAVALLLLFKDAPTFRGEAPASAWREAVGSAVTALTHPDSRGVFGLATLIMMARSTGNAFLPLLILSVYPSGDTATIVGALAGATALTGAVASPLAGGVGDRWGFRRVLAVALVVAGAGSLGVALASSLSGVAGAYVATTAMSYGASSLCAAMLATQVSGARRTTTLNLVLVPLYVGGTIGPPLGGLVAHQSVFWVYGANCVILAIAAAAALVLVRRGRGHSA